MTLTLDHVAIGGPDLDRLCAWFARATGIVPAYGGVHSGGASHNALAAMGDAYVELYAPTGAGGGRDRWIARSRAAARPVLLGWCWRAPGPALDRVAAACRRLGIVGEGPVAGGRERAGGTRLRWRLFEPEEGRFAPLLPFFIDWRDGAHPAADAPRGAELAHVRLSHPDPARVVSVFRELELTGPTPAAGPAAMAVTILGPVGTINVASEGVGE